MGRLDSVEVPYATPDPALPAPWRFRPRWRWLPSVVLSLTALAAGDAVVYAKGVSFFFDHVSACMILLPVAAVAVPLALKPRGRRLLGGMALGLVLAFGQLGFGHRQLGEDLMRRPIEQLTLFGQDEAARMAVKQRDIEAFFQRADLPRHGRLAQIQRFSRMREAAGLGHGMEDTQFIPIHLITDRPCRPC